MIRGNWKRLLTGILCVSLVLSETALMGIRSYAAETDGTADTFVMEEAEESTEKEESEADSSDDLGENEIGSSETVPETDTGLETQGTETEAAEQDTAVSEEESSAEGTEAEPAESEGTVTGEEIPEETSGEVVNDARTELPAEELLKLSPQDRLAAMASEDDIKSGIDNDIVWVIDVDGKLTVIGTGNYVGYHSSGRGDRPHWCGYPLNIKTAEVIVTGMTDASHMFSGCDGLSSIDLSGFDTSQVTDMSSMFEVCSSLNSIDLGGFDTSQATNMNSMFSFCKNLSGIDLSGFDTSQVTDMSSMFKDCSSLNSIDLNGFDTSQVTDMSSMFKGCSSLNSIDLNGFNTGNVTDMSEMFYRSGLSSLDLSGVNTSQVTNMKDMFYECKNLSSLNLSGFDTSQVTNMFGMFESCNKLSSLDLSSFDTSQVTNMGSMFRHCSVKNLNLSSFDTSQVTNMAFMFSEIGFSSLNLSGFDTSQVTSMTYMFKGCSSLNSIDLSGFDTSQVTSMYGMFEGCSSLNSLDLSGFNTSQVTSMSGMFEGCSSLNSLDLSGFDTSQVTSMSGMFEGCSSLNSVDVSGFDTSQVIYMGSMFNQCSNLSSVDVSGFDTSKVTIMFGMFGGCSNLSSLDVSGFDTSQVTEMDSMFGSCSNLSSIDLSGFDTSKVRHLENMLQNCSNLVTIYTPCNLELKVWLPKKYSIVQGTSVSTDIWYDSDGTKVTSLPMNLSYSVTLGKNYIPKGITVNGKGYSYANFILKNNKREVQKNAKMAYSYDGKSHAIAYSDENGLITIKSPLLENKSGKEEKQQIKTTDMILYYDSGETEKLNYSVTMNVTVIPLSFSQTWELGVEGTLTGSVGEEVGVEIGVAKLEAGLAAAEISGTVGGTLSVEHTFENGVRNLTLLQNYNGKIAANAGVGPAAEAGALGEGLEVDVVSGEAGAAAGGSVGIGLTLENYDPTDLNQISQIGRFMLASQAQASGNLWLLSLSEMAGTDFYNIEQCSINTSVEAGADVGSIEFKDTAVGTLASAGAGLTISFDMTRYRADSSKELAFGYEEEVSAGLLKIPTVGLSEGLLSGSVGLNVEISAELDGNDQVQSFGVKLEGDKSGGVIVGKSTVNAVTVSYGRDAVEQLTKNIGVVKDFAAGSIHYIFGDAQQGLFEQLDTTPLKASFSSTVAEQEYINEEFDLGLMLELGLEAGVAFEGVYSCEHETAGGTYEAGKGYVTNTNEIEKEVKANSYSIVQLVGEPLTTVAESLWDFLVDAYGSVKDGIQNALAELRQSLSETAEEAKDWLLHIIALKKDNAASTELQSYAITAYRTEKSLERTADAAADAGTEADEYKVYTIGDPYCVYVTDQAGNEITDYSVNPLTLTLRYTDEMLLAAGIDRTQVNNIAIYMYSEEVYGYVCIGGTVDAADGSVSVEITEPGQYVLAADGAAPAVKDIKISKNTYKPVITVTFSEASGFQEFSMKLDGEEVIGAADWKKHYNKVYNSFSYQVEKELAAGKHTCSVYAVDTAGNAMSVPYETEFYIEAPKYTVTFDADDGTTPIKVTVAEGEKAAMPETPVRKGYVFKGWYTGKDGQGTEFTAQSEVTADMTVYACWLQMEQGDVLTEDIPADGIIPDGIWAAGIVDVSYTGTAVKQSFRLYDGRKRLKEKTDYTVSYKNNKAAYTYTDADYKTFEENQKKTGQSIAAGTFDPKKAPQAVIRMKGNYSGKRLLYFRIEPVELSEAGYEADSLTVTYTGKKQTPVPKLVWNGRTLKYGTDFRIPEYDQAKNDKAAFKEPREYSLTLTGMKNFKGEIPVTLTISKSVKQIAMNKVTVKGMKNMPWTGQQVIQTGFTVKYKNHMLSEENGDYTVQWGANTDAGTGTVIFTGTGEDRDGDGFSFVGTKKVSFKITGKSMSKVSVSGVEKNYTYTGTQIMPVATLTYKENKNAAGITLTEGVHYKVTYQKNEEKGTATILFTGLGSGGFTGTKKQTFKITAQEFGDDISISFTDTENVKDGSYTAPYMKGGAKPQVTVTSGTKTLQPDKDYKVSYQNNKKLGLSTDAKAPVVIITGKGNYKGSKSIKFSIAAKPLSNENGITVVAKDKAESTKKNGYRQSFKVYDADGTALGSGDYEAKNAVYTLIQTKNADGTVTSVNQVLDKDSVVPAGSVIRITVQGKGIYAGGEATGTYRIIENNHDISKATIQISNQTYTGEPVLITEQSQFSTGKVFIKLGGVKKELVLGEDIEVVPGSYIKNVNKGTAKVTFRGINDFGGTKTVSYKIGTRSIADVWQGIYAKMAGFFRK